MPVRAQPHHPILTHGVGHRHWETVIGIDELKIGMRLQKLFDLSLVFFSQEAARGVNQASPGPDAPTRRMQDTGLLGQEPIKLFGCQAPLEIRISPQSSHTGARRVDEHTVSLTRQTRNTVILLASDNDRVDIAQPAPSNAGLGLGQARRGNIKRVQAPRGSHHGTQGQGFTAGARAKVNHHLAALGGY